MKDEIIEEVRRNRDEFAARFGYDLHKMFEYLREQQAIGNRKYVSLVEPQKKNKARPTKEAA